MSLILIIQLKGMHSVVIEFIKLLVTVVVQGVVRELFIVWLLYIF